MKRYLTVFLLLSISASTSEIIPPYFILKVFAGSEKTVKELSKHWSLDHKAILKSGKYKTIGEAVVLLKNMKPDSLGKESDMSLIKLINTKDGGKIQLIFKSIKLKSDRGPGMMYKIISVKRENKKKSYLSPF